MRELRDASVVIQSGGLGYEVFVARPTLDRCRQGETVQLSTRLVVREDAWLLFGFHDKDLLTLFDLLTGVSGVGPKLALALLSQLPPAVLAGAIFDGDARLLSSVSGVGKKTAERLVLELQGKVPEHLRVAPTQAGRGRPSNPAVQDAVDALIALGYREVQVRSAVAELAQAAPEATADQLIRKALGKLR